MTAPTRDAADRAGLPLTEQTSCGGCAAKLGADVLAEALAGLGALRAADGDGADATPEALLIGLDAPDDAAVYRLSDDLAVVGTLDFFPPLVDDPADLRCHRRCQCDERCLRDGRPGPLRAEHRRLPRGAAARDDDGDLRRAPRRRCVKAAASWPAATPSRIPSRSTVWRSSAPSIPTASCARARRESGDTLLLTKPLGTGILVSADRSDRTAPEHLAAAVASMRRLNRAAADVLVESGVRAATDVTGFGLLGHATEMARGSGTRFVIEAGQLPALDGALALAAEGVETGGAAHNRRFAAPTLTIHAGHRPRPVRCSPSTRRRQAGCWRPCRTIASPPSWPASGRRRSAGGGSGVSSRASPASSSSPERWLAPIPMTEREPSIRMTDRGPEPHRPVHIERWSPDGRLHRRRRRRGRGAAPGRPRW